MVLRVLYSIIKGSALAEPHFIYFNQTTVLSSVVVWTTLVILNPASCRIFVILSTATSPVALTTTSEPRSV